MRLRQQENFMPIEIKSEFNVDGKIESRSQQQADDISRDVHGSDRIRSDFGRIG